MQVESDDELYPGETVQLQISGYRNIWGTDIRQVGKYYIMTIKYGHGHREGVITHFNRRCTEIIDHRPNAFYSKNEIYNLVKSGEKVIVNQTGIINEIDILPYGAYLLHVTHENEYRFWYDTEEKDLITNYYNN